MTISMPSETLALIDAVAGPRGRTAWMRDVLVSQARRAHTLMVIRETAGTLSGSTTWGGTPEEIDATLHDLRDSSGRDRELYGAEW